MIPPKHRSVAANDRDEDRITDFYVSRVNWLVSPDRDDLIDAVAEEYRQHLLASRLGLADRLAG
jgi:hypothetical protein